VTHYTFPTVQALAQEGVEEKLRGLGFGYRAKYIAQSAQHIAAQHEGEMWLTSLRQKPYAEARSELLKLCGVGPKVRKLIKLSMYVRSGICIVEWVRDYIHTCICTNIEWRVLGANVCFGE
jgi:N-glycosylase/DNA lyase